MTRGCCAGILLLVFFGLWQPLLASDDGWWPKQAAPRGVVRSCPPQELPAPHESYHMLLQSIAGLAAAGVNDGRCDELVWVDTGSPEIEAWYAATVQRPPAPRERGRFGPWELVERYRKLGLIKGYVLYRVDKSQGELNEHRPGLDNSVNVATTLAGLLGGVLVEEGLETEAATHGLKRLEDARGKTQAWCFETYKDRLSRRMICLQDPRKPHARDLAIAHRTLAIYGNEPPLREALAWLEPLSPVIGWNGGDEFETTKLTTVQGHIQTATDWCMNLPVLMAGSSTVTLPMDNSFDPRSIDWNDKRSGISFISTDGDNVQWLEGSFFHNASYWQSTDRGRIPFGWSCCFTQLAQLCPVAIERALATRTPNDSLIEWGGGYYYPDLFARDRPHPPELLARQARRTWAQMKRTNTQIIGFNFAKLDTKETIEACRTFAGETNGLLAILAFQYAPYEEGAGKTFWVADRRGRDVPVISARYSLWEHAHRRPRAGTPAKIAREIRQSVENTAAEEGPRFDWSIAHVWSYFRKAPGADELAEDMPQSDAPQNGGVRGITPVAWATDRLPNSIRVIAPEEMAWRIRMRHNPAQTRSAIAGD